MSLTDDEIRLVHPDYPSPIAEVNRLYAEHAEQVYQRFSRLAPRGERPALAPNQMVVTIHEIAKDGLPPEEGDGGMSHDLTGRVAFIFDGCIVSGWPLPPEEHPDVYRRNSWSVEDGGVLWEGDEDVSNNRPKGNVTHWVEFPVPVWEIGR